MRYQGAFGSLTDVGKVRISNEDQAFAASNNLGEVMLLVCDGMGGQNKGDCASKLACDFIHDSFQKKRKIPGFLLPFYVSNLLKKANSLIYSESQRSSRYEGMGTTCCLTLISGENLIVGNVGDSRCYCFDSGVLTQLSQDQTYVDYLYRTGKITKAQTTTRSDRHVLLNALGIYPSSSSEVKRLHYSGQSILLCSDGLYNNLPEAEIRAILATDDRVDEKIASLIEEANSNGGSDNIAVSYFEANR